jgi:hypothetical protein
MQTHQQADVFAWRAGVRAVTIGERNIKLLSVDLRRHKPQRVSELQ